MPIREQPAEPSKPDEESPRAEPEPELQNPEAVGRARDIIDQSVQELEEDHRSSSRISRILDSCKYYACLFVEVVGRSISTIGVRIYTLLFAFVAFAVSIISAMCTRIHPLASVRRFLLRKWVKLFGAIGAILVLVPLLQLCVAFWNRSDTARHNAKVEKHNASMETLAKERLEADKVQERPYLEVTADFDGLTSDIEEDQHFKILFKNVGSHPARDIEIRRIDLYEINLSRVPGPVTTVRRAGDLPVSASFSQQVDSLRHENISGRVLVILSRYTDVITSTVLTQYPIYKKWKMGERKNDRAEREPFISKELSYVTKDEETRIRDSCGEDIRNFYMSESARKR